MLTEEEARKKWCPHAVASHTDPRDGFRSDSNEYAKAKPIHACIASACMAWRWAVELVDPNPMNFRIPGPNPTKRERGFCGLAGKPED